MESVPPTSFARRGESPLLLALGALAVVAAYFWLVSPFWEQINDDAFITFRYSRALADGHGPYFNPGEHVEGYTNLSLMLLIAGVIDVFGPDAALFAAKLIGVSSGLVAGVAAALLAGLWATRISRLARTRGTLALTAGALVATNSALALNSTTGLETTLFSAFVTLGLLLGLLGRHRQRWRGAGLAFALGVLTRPEGTLVFLAALAGRMLGGDRSRRAIARGVIDTVIVALTVAGVTIFRYVTYDRELAPNTFYAKLGGFTGGGTAGQYVTAYITLHLAWIGLLLAIIPFVLHTRSQWREGLPILAVFVAGFVAIFAAGPDWMPGYRLLVPYAPAGAVLMSIGVGVAISALSSAPPRPLYTVAAGAGLVALLTFWQAPQRDGYIELCRTRAAGYAHGHAALVEWLERHASAGDTVALMDIGMVGYLCPQLRILDITGLTDRYIAKSPGGFLAKQFDASYVFDQAPRFIVAVFTAPARGDGRVAFDRLDHWTSIEANLLADPRFLEHYARTPATLPTTSRRAEPPSEKAELARALRAASVFEHDHPGGIRYFLAVYERR